MKKLLVNFNKAFESRVRLGVMSVLMVNESVDFITLKELLNLSDGKHSLLDIAERASMPFARVLEAARLLEESGRLVEA